MDIKIVLIGLIFILGGILRILVRPKVTGLQWRCWAWLCGEKVAWDIALISGVLAIIIGIMFIFLAFSSP